MPKNTRSIAAVVAKLQEHCYTVKLDSFRRSAEDEEALKLFSAFRDRAPFERSPLDLQLIFAFDNDTFEWLEWLQANDHDKGEDWHLITIDPRTSPLIDVDDWLWASPNKCEALGWLLEVMDRVRAEPLALKTDVAGDLVIEGQRGPLATISPIEFQSGSLERDGRVVRCLRNLRCHDPDSLIARKLEKIEGLSGVTPVVEGESATPRNIYSNRQCLDISCANLCSSFLEALQPHVVEPIKQSFAQELVASYFGFDSWNTFRGLEKKRDSAVYQAYRVSQIEVIDEYETVDKQHKFYRSLASAIVEFGQEMKHQDNTRPINISPGKRLKLDNVTMAPHPNHPMFHVRTPCKAMEMEPILRPKVEESYLELAERMLVSDDLEQEIREYFFTGLDPFNRIKKIDLRFGYRPDDHLKLGPWIFSLNRENPSPVITVELLENVGNYDRENSFTAAQHKASVVSHDGEFWLASDWDQKPEFHLKGLNIEDVEKLERAFLNRENWIMWQIDR